MKLKAQIAILAGVVAIFAVFNILCYNLVTRRYTYPRDERLKAKSIELDKYLPFKKDSLAVTTDASVKLTGDLPVIDSAAALYPVSAGIVGSTYPESSVKFNGTDFEEGSSLLMNNTIGAYEEIVTGQADIIICAGPSKEQLQVATDMGVELVLVPIGREAMVFFVNENNPVNDLTVDQIRDIYAGRITSWSEVGGDNHLITAISRNQGSGSQTMMEKFVMNGEKIAIDYDAVFGRAIAFSFRFYVNDITNYGGIKILSLNGVYPTPETIADNSYPLSSEFYAIYRADNDNPNIPILIDWILSDEGQSVIESNGYVRVN